VEARIEGRIHAGRIVAGIVKCSNHRGHEGSQRNPIAWLTVFSRDAALLTGAVAEVGCDLEPIASAFLGAIQSFIGSLDYLFNVVHLWARLRDPDTDGDRQFAGGSVRRKPARSASSRGILFVIPPATCAPRSAAALRSRAHAESGCFYGGSELPKMRRDILHGLSRKQNRKFFSSDAECLAASSYPGQPGRDHPQNLVAGIVSVGVVEVFEVVDVDGRDGVGRFEPQQCLVEGAACRQ